MVIIFFNIITNEYFEFVFDTYIYIGILGNNNVDPNIIGNGVQGNQGDIGATGAQGTAGTNGTNGAQGFQGNNGSNGTNGAQGATGPQGPAGTGGSGGVTVEENALYTYVPALTANQWFPITISGFSGLDPTTHRVIFTLQDTFASAIGPVFLVQGSIQSATQIRLVFRSDGYINGNTVKVYY